MRQYLRKEGLRPKIVPILTPKHKVARLSFAKKALRSEQVSWRCVMITNSEIFRLSPMGGPAGRWCTRATRGTVGRPKHSDGVHAYMGMTWWGFTPLKLATGTHHLPKKYINLQIRQFQIGVGSKEYNDVLQQHFIPEGNRLFQQSGHWIDNWKLQQDNAPAHETKENMECITVNVPGGHLLKWPSSSPDLSPIEALWAWMEQQLGPGEVIKTTTDLAARLNAIRDSITVEQLRALLKGMEARMRRCLDRQGGHIGQ